MATVVKNALQIQENTLYSVKGHKKADAATDTIVSITVSVMAYTTQFDTMQRIKAVRCNFVSLTLFL